MPLAINSNMLGFFRLPQPLLPLIFVYPLLLSKLILFPAAHKTCLRKTTISDSFTVGSS